MHKIDEAIGGELKVGIDPEATPECVNACIAKARYFGDLENPTSEVSRLAADRRAFRLLEELETEPSVYYLAP